MSTRRRCSRVRVVRRQALGLGWLLVFLDFHRSADLDGGAEAFVVGVAHGHANVYRAGAEAQLVVGARVGGKPVVAFNIFSESFKARENVFVALLDDVRDSFPITLDDVEVLVVDPDAPL